MPYSLANAGLRHIYDLEMGASIYFVIKTAFKWAIRVRLGGWDRSPDYISDRKTKRLSKCIKKKIADHGNAIKLLPHAHTLLF